MFRVSSFLRLLRDSGSWADGGGREREGGREGRREGGRGRERERGREGEKREREREGGREERERNRGREERKNVVKWSNTVELCKALKIFIHMIRTCINSIYTHTITL